MDEFALIREVVDNLGDVAQGRWVELGPGDDAAIIGQSPGCQAVASIDTLVADVHFPASAPPEFIGYRALMVALSDLAAMAAKPRYVLVALNLPAADAHWVGALARGMANAAARCDTYLCGGNFARGPLSITVSVHGEVPDGTAVTRSGARVGDEIFISGELGGAAACTRLREFDFTGALNLRQQKYIQPLARVDLIDTVRGAAHAAIDVSDGLLKDMEHVCLVSGVQADVIAADVPVCDGASLEDALHGGDDYEILCTAAAGTTAEDLPGFTCIGTITAGRGVCLDGQAVTASGYNHFAS